MNANTEKMIMTKNWYITILLLLTISACKNKENKAIAIDNSRHNKIGYLPHIKESTSITDRKSVNTVIDVPVMQVNLGTLEMEKEKRAFFAIKNIGTQPLVIYNVVASCDCTKVTYDKKPIPPNRKTTIQVTYTADGEGYFRKTVTLYCNVAESPLYFKIVGDVTN